MKTSNRLSLEQKNHIGTGIVETVEKNFEKILKRKPDPEMLYNRLFSIVDKHLKTQENYLKILSLLPKDSKMMREIVAKITNYNITDHRGNNILHLLVKKDRLDLILHGKLHNLNLWEKDNNMGIKPIDLLLYKLLFDESSRDNAITILRNLIDKRMLSEHIANHIADSMLGLYKKTKDRLILEILIDLGKKYGRGTIKPVAQQILNLPEISRDYREYMLWEEYIK